MFLFVLDSWSEAEQTIEFPISAFGTKKNCLGARGISGAEGRPVVPSTWRRRRDRPRTATYDAGVQEAEIDRGAFGKSRLHPLTCFRTLLPGVRGCYY